VVGEYKIVFRKIGLAMPQPFFIYIIDKDGVMLNAFGEDKLKKQYEDGRISKDMFLKIANELIVERLMEEI
jgi:hypothetical protein